MKILQPGIHLDLFFDKIQTGYPSLLILDYDGTLAPFQTNPQDAKPYDGILEALSSLMHNTNTRIVIVSGRAIADLLFLLPLDPLPEIWGTHGFERMTAKEGYQKELLSYLQQKGIAKAIDFIRKELPAARLEQKPGSVALHWRGEGQKQIEKIKQQIQGTWEEIGNSHELSLLSFNGGIELRPRDIDKGKAVEEIMNAHKSAYAAIAYLGDDRTDEDAFQALGEKGLKVLVTDEDTITCADIQLTPPEELLYFLHRWEQYAKRQI